MHFSEVCVEIYQIPIYVKHELLQKHNGIKICQDCISVLRKILSNYYRNNDGNSIEGEQKKIHLLKLQYGYSFWIKFVSFLITRSVSKYTNTYLLSSELINKKIYQIVVGSHLTVNNIVSLHSRSCSSCNRF